MCDYSMYSVASRPARAGDKLVTGSFPTTTTRGFAAVDEPGVAVCLLPGTELAFENDIEWRRPLMIRFFRGKQDLRKLVQFRQINLDEPDAHHDAIEFPNGRVILLMDLRKGQRAKVLQLPVVRPAPQERLSQSQADGPVIDLAPMRGGLTDRSEWVFVWRRPNVV